MSHRKECGYEHDCKGWVHPDPDCPGCPYEAVPLPEPTVAALKAEIQLLAQEVIDEANKSYDFGRRHKGEEMAPKVATLKAKLEEGKRRLEDGREAWRVGGKRLADERDALRDKLAASEARERGVRERIDAEEVIASHALKQDAPDSVCAASHRGALSVLSRLKALADLQEDGT